jgi:hypothetical protein
MNFLTILEEVGGLAESLFAIIGIFFATYAATNYKLEFVQQAFKQRLNDSPYDPSVYRVGTVLDNEILTTLKDYVEPTLMKKTLPIFLYDMFSNQI